MFDFRLFCAQKIGTTDSGRCHPPMKAEHSVVPKTHIRILGRIFQRHVLSHSRTRMLAIIFIILTLASKLIEIWSIKAASQLQNDFDNLEPNGKAASALFYILLNFVFFSLNEGLSYAFSGPIQRSTRVVMRESLETALALTHSSFTKTGAPTLYTLIERRGLAVFDILDVVILEVFPATVAFTAYAIFLANGLGVYIPMVMAFFFIIFLTTTFYITKQRTKIRSLLNQRANELCTVLYDTLLNVDTVRAYNGTQIEVKRTDDALARVEKQNVALLRSLFMLNFAQRTIFLIQLCVVLTIGAYGFYTKSFDGPDLLMYIGFARSLGIYLFKSGYLYGRYSLGMLNFASSTLPGEKERLTGTDIKRLRESIKARNLKVILGDRTILSNINFRILVGSKVAVVGRNGIGKSTLLRTLLGFNDYTGQILFDDNELNSLSLSSIRDRIAYIHQEAGIFNDTVRHNITYGSFDATDGDIISAAKAMGVHESVERLQHGYLTHAGERGSALSGGEKQKIAFVRAQLKKDADIIMLDEPTASLDKEAEAVILQKLFEMGSGKTIFMILHNLNFLDRFDTILFLSEKSSQAGSLSDLIETNAEFSAFYKQRA